MNRYQAQAVLRRTSTLTPLRLVGVTLASVFFPRTPADGGRPLLLTKGLVALAPLTAIDAKDPGSAAIIASDEAQAAWRGLDASAEDPDQ